MTEPPAGSGPRRLKTGRVFLALYLVLLAAIILSQLLAAPVTDFNGPVANRFRVALFATGSGADGKGHRVTNLRKLAETTRPATGFSFLAPSQEVILRSGDVQRVRVLETHADHQLIAFHYANTHSSISTYRAWADRVEPVSYRVTSSVGQVMFAALAIVPVWLLALLLTFTYNRWYAHRAE